MLERLLACTGKKWSPAIGDPTVIGWVTFFAYVLAVILCLSVLSRNKTRGNMVFWLTLSIFLALLAMNKQLDIQSAATAFGRCMALAQGWYEDRRTVQFWAVVGMICLMSMACVLILVTMRNALTSIWPAVLGIYFLSMFIALRAAEFHHFGALISQRFMNLRVTWILELAGIELVTVNALFLIFKAQK